MSILKKQVRYFFWLMLTISIFSTPFVYTVSFIDDQIAQVKDELTFALQSGNSTGYTNALYDLQDIDEDEDVKISIITNLLEEYGPAPIDLDFSGGIDNALEGNNTALSFQNVGTGLPFITRFDEDSDTTYLRALVAGDNITITSDENTVTISGPEQALSTGANLGTGAGFYLTNIGSMLAFYSVRGGSNVVVAGPTSGTITLSSNAVSGAANIGTGAQSILVTGQSNLQFKTISAGSPTTLANPDANTIQINSIPTVTGANLGAGAGTPYASNTGLTLNFNSIKAGSNVGVTTASNTINVTTNAVTGAANLGGANALLVTGQSNLQFKSLAAGTYATLTAGSTSITVDASSTTQTVSFPLVDGDAIGATNGTFKFYRIGKQVIAALTAYTFNLNSVTSNSLNVYYPTLIPSTYCPRSTIIYPIRINISGNTPATRVGQLVVFPNGDVNIWYDYYETGVTAPANAVVTVVATAVAWSALN